VNYKTANVFALQIIFMLLTALFLLKTEEGNVVRGYAGSLFFLMMSVFCHETAMFMPLYLIVILVFGREYTWKMALVRCLPHIAVLGSYALWRMGSSSLKSTILDHWALFNINIAQYAATWTQLIVWYLKQMVYPVGTVLIWVTPVLEGKAVILYLT